MYEVDYNTSGVIKGTKHLRVKVSEFTKESLKIAQSLALKNGFDPSGHDRMKVKNAGGNVLDI